MTAEAIRDQQQAPQCPLIQSSLLREQNFGIAEGKPWKARRRPSLSLEENYAKEIFPALSSRHDKFPQGESLDDLAERAEQAIHDLLIPYVATNGNAHIAVASHGLFIKEILSILLRMNADGVDGPALDQVWRGLRNTAWTRLKIEMRNDLPGLDITAIAVNQYDHLSTVVSSNPSESRGSNLLSYDKKVVSAVWPMTRSKISGISLEEATRLDIGYCCRYDP